jgi:hypothetical protein
LSTHEKVITSSHLGLINVGGIDVPIGFLASHRKKHHEPCKKYSGFIVLKVKGELVNHVCPCVVPQAIKKLKKVGRDEWSRLAGEWLALEKVRLAEDEKRCELEGYEAAADATCPYPDKTDQELWWRAGRARAGHDREAQVEIEHGEEEKLHSDPWAEGADAALAGDSETSNPYDPSDDEHLSWNDGYASVADAAKS